MASATAFQRHQQLNSGGINNCTPTLSMTAFNARWHQQLHSTQDGINNCIQRKTTSTTAFNTRRHQQCIWLINKQSCITKASTTYSVCINNAFRWHHANIQTKALFKTTSTTRYNGINYGINRMHYNGIKGTHFNGINNTI